MNTKEAIQHCRKLADHMRDMDSESGDAIAIETLLCHFSPTEKKPFVIERTVKLEVHPYDLPEPMTYVDAVKAVAKLGNGWRIPTREELFLMYERKDQIGGFKTKPSRGSDFPDWYWSSTEHRDNPSFVWLSRFSDGHEDWSPKDGHRLSCRPVRLVEVSAP